MRKFYLIGFSILLFFDTFAQISFKFAGMSTAPPSLDIEWVLRVITEPWTYGAILGYLGAFFTYMTLLEHAPVGPAFAATHAEIVTVMIFSIMFLNESMSPLQILGSLFIVAGICVLAFGQKERAHLTQAADNTRV